MVDKHAHPRTRPRPLHRRQMRILNCQQVDSPLVGRYKRCVGWTGGEKRTGVCTDAEHAHRGVDRGELESGHVGKGGGFGLGVGRGRRVRVSVGVDTITGESKKLEGPVPVTGCHEQRTAMYERKVPCTRWEVSTSAILSHASEGQSVSTQDSDAARWTYHDQVSRLPIPYCNAGSRRINAIHDPHNVVGDLYEHARDGV